MSNPSTRSINTQRAGWAAAALEAFQAAVGEHDRVTAIADLIADLGHLTKKHRLNYLKVLKRGIRAWAYEERELHGLGTSPSVSIRIGPTRPVTRPAKGGAR